MIIVILWCTYDSKLQNVPNVNIFTPNKNGELDFNTSFLLYKTKGRYNQIFHDN